MTGVQTCALPILAGNIEASFQNFGTVVPYIRSGKMKALAVTSRERMPQLPDVPTVAETVPGYEYIAWNGYAVTGGVPKEVAERLEKALAEIAKDPEVIKVFSNLGIDSAGTTQAQAIASIRKDMPIYAEIVDLAGVKRK